MFDKQILSTYSLEQLQTVLRDCIKEFSSSTSAPPTDNDELITENEAIKILLVSKPTISKWRREGRIPFYRIGSRIRYKKSELLSGLSSPKKFGRSAK